MVKPSNVSSVTTRSHAKKDGTKKDKRGARRAQAGTSSLERRKKKKPKESSITPVWIEYYNQQANQPDSDYGKGVLRPTNYFEDLMDQVVGDEDNLLEVLKVNPEACAFAYADTSGLMRVVHHLTATVHGGAIIVGLEGFGGKSSIVKIIDSIQFVDKIQLDSKVAQLTVPSLAEFMSSDLEDIEMEKGEESEEVTEVTTLSQILGNSPKGFLFHPRWLNIIYRSFDGEPSKMAKSIVDYGRATLKCDEDYSGDDLADLLDEFHPFLIYLWACHHKWVSIGGGRSRTYTLDNSGFETIQSDITRKSLAVRPNVPVEGAATPSQPPKPTEGAATPLQPPKPTFNRPPPPPLKSTEEATEGGISHRNKEQAPSAYLN